MFISLFSLLFYCKIFFRKIFLSNQTDPKQVRFDPYRSIIKNYTQICFTRSNSTDMSVFGLRNAKRIQKQNFQYEINFRKNIFYIFKCLFCKKKKKQSNENIIILRVLIYLFSLLFFRKISFRKSFSIKYFFESYFQRTKRNLYSKARSKLFMYEISISLLSFYSCNLLKIYLKNSLNVKRFLKCNYFLNYFTFIDNNIIL